MDDVLASRKLKDARRALQILEKAGHQAMLAGGCVRDRLLGIAPKDYDIATNAVPSAVMSAFKVQGLKTIPTGIDHGTVTLVMNSGPVEITTLRTDLVTDGRHAEVAFGTSFAEDAARRDFTVNAMFEDAAGNIHDFCGGRADLEARVLRFVGEPAARIREDYLRILRFFRFWARLNFAADARALAAIETEKAGLRRISQERVTGELLQIIAAPFAEPAMRSMADSGVWMLVAPELVAAGQSAPPIIAWEQLVSIPATQRSLAVLAVLTLLSQRKRGEGQALGMRLKLSRADTRLLEHAVSAFDDLATFPDKRSLIMEFLDAAEQAGGEGSFNAFFAPVWRAAITITDSVKLAALAAAEATEARFHALRCQKLPITGEDLQRAPLSYSGKAIGDALLALKRSFRDGIWSTREEGVHWLSQTTG